VRGNWSGTRQMPTIEESLAELAHWVQRTGNKPFSFTEIGYSASPLNNSSEEKQADIVRGMFRVLDPYRQKGQIAFILYHAMHAYPPGGAYRMPSSKVSRWRPFSAWWRIWDCDVTRRARRGKRGARWSKV
jgi:hypothetical protein